ncbi:MAG: hypothetical protein KDA32_00975 [Phycisphaerales bacterium]|nr:hypothetical protein [Phycisphaerales bacterium]
MRTFGRLMRIALAGLVLAASAHAVTITSITPAELGPTNLDTLAFTVVFSENVTGFAADDVDVDDFGTTHGAVTVTGSGSSYTVEVANVAGDGGLSIAVGPGAVLDGGSSPNADTFSSVVVIVDNTPPTITITPDMADVGTATSAEFWIEANDEIVGLEPNDIEVVHDGTSHSDVIIEEEDSITHKVIVSGLLGGGTLSLKLPADALTDSAGNGNALATSADVTRTAAADETDSKDDKPADDDMTDDSGDTSGDDANSPDDADSTDDKETPATLEGSVEGPFNLAFYSEKNTSFLVELENIGPGDATQIQCWVYSDASFDDLAITLDGTITPVGQTITISRRRYAYFVLPKLAEGESVAIRLTSTERGGAYDAPQLRVATAEGFEKSWDGSVPEEQTAAPGCAPIFGSVMLTPLFLVGAKLYRRRGRRVA